MNHTRADFFIIKLWGIYKTYSKFAGTKYAHFQRHIFNIHRDIYMLISLLLRFECGYSCISMNTIADGISSLSLRWITCIR